MDTEGRVSRRWAAAVDDAGDRVRALLTRVRTPRTRAEAAVGLSGSRSSGDALGGEDGSSTASTADEYFISALDWLSLTYRSTPFWTERDIVYTLQRQLAEELHRQGAPWRVLSGHRINPGERPAVSADLVLVSSSGAMALDAEFKYEPCHSRPDISKGKFPVAVWTDVVKDLTRAEEMVNRGAQLAYAVFIDEGGWSTRRDRTMFETRSEWETDCPCGRHHQVEVLIHRVPAANESS